MKEFSEYSGPLTIGLWMMSFLGIAIAFSITNRWKELQPNLISSLLRYLFCFLVGLTIWLNSAYAFWLGGFELKIEAVANGKMQSNGWFPPLVLLWTVLTYFSAKPAAEKS